MRTLATDSLILFGSHLSGRFVLDTVFVVDGTGVDYNAANPDVPGVSNEYQELSLNRLEKGEFTFYRGRTSSTAAGKTMFSFSPAKRFVKGDGQCGERFALDISAVNRLLSTDHLSPGIRQGFKVVEANQTAIVRVWQEIVRQVRAAGFLPAVHFDWPR